MGKRLGHFGSWQRAQIETPAARTYRGEQSPGCVRDKQQYRACRRFLEEFQQRIGRVVVQIIGAIDNGDTPAARPGR
jgi:hypothetical protein